jgi:hypothetical protein
MRLTGHPYTFQAGEIRLNHLAARCPHDVEYGCVGGRYPIAVLVDKQLVVGSVDRVVEDGSVQPQLHSWDSIEWPEQRKSVSNLRRQGASDAFFGAAVGYLRTVGIAKGNAHRDARTGFVGRMPRRPASSARKRAL